MVPFAFRAKCALLGIWEHCKSYVHELIDFEAGKGRVFNIFPRKGHSQRRSGRNDVYVYQLQSNEEHQFVLTSVLDGLDRLAPLPLARRHHCYQHPCQ